MWRVCQDPASFEFHWHLNILNPKSASKMANFWHPFARLFLVSVLVMTASRAQSQQESPPATTLPSLIQSIDRASVLELPTGAVIETPAISQPVEVANQAPRSVQPPDTDAIIGLPDLGQPSPVFGTAGQLAGDEKRFQGAFTNQNRFDDIGRDFYAPPEFKGGLLIFGNDVAMKIGGYAKADFIYDLDPIDSTDSFVTTSIPIGAAPRTNARFHARQTRLSADTRWITNHRTIRMFVEGDFFSNGNSFRLRHAYGEVESLLVGQTWTTFTDVAAAPSTLDFEGSVSNVNRRQAQIRLTRTLFHEDLKLALAMEDTQFIIQTPEGLTGDARSPSPDFVSHLRWEPDWGRFQFAGLYRIGGFQPSGASTVVYGDDVITGNAWGLNCTGVVLLSDVTKTYYQVLYGEGIGSYRNLPDAAPTSDDRSGILPLFGWMVGVTHQWSDELSSNFTYGENELDTTLFQQPDDVQRTTYLAMNLIWTPLERVHIGIEYLYGIRQDVSGGKGSANRIQSAVIFDLP